VRPLAGPAVQIISPYHLYLNPKLVVQHYEIWRLVTNFLYFRKMGMRSVPSMPLLRSALTCQLYVVWCG
jgi:hypothetical protein